MIIDYFTFTGKSQLPNYLFTVISSLIPLLLHRVAHGLLRAAEYSCWSLTVISLFISSVVILGEIVSGRKSLALQFTNYMLIKVQQVTSRTTACRLLRRGKEAYTEGMHCSMQQTILGWISDRETRTAAYDTESGRFHKPNGSQTRWYGTMTKNMA